MRVEERRGNGVEERNKQRERSATIRYSCTFEGAVIRRAADTFHFVCSFAFERSGRTVDVLLTHI